jgi:hypothetical protein
MDRRTFNKTLIGGAVVGSLPISSVAATAQPVAGPLYAWAAAIARAQNRISPELLVQQLRVSPTVARGIYERLLTKGVVRAPMLSGIARASDPLLKGGQFQVVEASINRSAKAAFKDVARKLDGIAQEDAPEPEDLDAPDIQAT